MRWLLPRLTTNFKALFDSQFQTPPISRRERCRWQLPSSQRLVVIDNRDEGRRVLFPPKPVLVAEELPIRKLWNSIQTIRLSPSDMLCGFLLSSCRIQWGIPSMTPAHKRICWYSAVRWWAPCCRILFAFAATWKTTEWRLYINTRLFFASYFCSQLGT